MEGVHYNTGEESIYVMYEQGLNKAELNGSAHKLKKPHIHV